MLFSLIITSCNIDKKRKLTKGEILSLKKHHNDSILTIFDSIYEKKIYAPPLFDKATIDSITTHSFFELAKKTKGELKILIDSKLIIDEIKHIIKKNATDNADILFLIDKTGSMADDIINVQKGLTNIINAIKEYDNIRLAIGLYGDKNSDGKNWYSFKNFDTNLNTAKKFIQKIIVTNGDDYPESVYDGFFETTKENFWKSNNKRMIILIGDAPPLEKPFSNHTMNDVINHATKEKITMNFYPIVIAPEFFNELGIITKPKLFKKHKLVSSFYPNPSPGRVNINLLEKDNYILEIFDTNGKLLKTKKYYDSKLFTEFYDLPNGIYLIRIANSKMQYDTIKILVNK